MRAVLGELRCLPPTCGKRTAEEPLEHFLNDRVFAGKDGSTLVPEQADVDGFAKFMQRYEAGLGIETTAVNAMN